MSSDPMSEDEQPEVDDNPVPEVVRKPIKTTGDLSEAGDSAGITVEELLRRVQRIEEYLRIGAPDEPKAFDYPSRELPDRSGGPHPIARTSGLEDQDRRERPPRLRDPDN